MFARLAGNLGQRLAASLHLNEDAAERAAYALELLFLDLLTLICIGLAAWLAGAIGPAIAALATTALMRLVSGGAHSESPWVCLALSTVLTIAFGLLGRTMGNFITYSVGLTIAGVIFIGGVIVLAKFAPADSPAKPIKPMQAKKLKILSLVFIAAWVLAMPFVPLKSGLFGASALGMLWQLSSITPAAYGFSRALDRLLWVKEVKNNA